MKVAIFTDSFLPQVNGVTSVICQQIKNLEDRGFEVVVFVPGDKTEMTFFSKTRVYRLSGLKVSFYPDYLLAKPSNAHKIQTLIQMEAPDIYHVHTPFTMGVFGVYFGKKYNKPIVGTFHTLISEYTGHLAYGLSENFFKFILKKPIWKYLKSFYMRCDKTIALGKQISQLLNKNGIRNTVIIPNGVDISAFKKIKTKNIRKVHNIPSNKTLFFYLGRVSVEKKLPLLIKAFSEANKQNNFYLLIGGKGPQLEKYNKIVKEDKIKNVKFLGFVKDEDIPSYYKSTDVFISASDTETQGITFLEAQIHGSALIGSNKMGSKDMIKNGINGLTFKAGDKDDLVKKLVKLGNDKKTIKKMRNNSKRVVLDYSIDLVQDKHITLYKKLINKKR